MNLSRIVFFLFCFVPCRAVSFRFVPNCFVSSHRFSSRSLNIVFLSFSCFFFCLCFFLSVLAFLSVFFCVRVGGVLTYIGGGSTTTFDVCYHPEALVRARRIDAFRDLLALSSLERVEDAFLRSTQQKMTADKSELRRARSPTGATENLGRARREGSGCSHVLMFMHGRSGMTIDPWIPAISGRSTSGFHRPGRHSLHQARSTGMVYFCHAWP